MWGSGRDSIIASIVRSKTVAAQNHTKAKKETQITFNTQFNIHFTQSVPVCNHNKDLCNFSTQWKKNEFYINERTQNMELK